MRDGSAQLRIDGVGEEAVLDLSFIIVSWNASQYLINCLRSIFETVEGLTFEVLVVDNGSSDRSPDAVREQFPEVRLNALRENLGFGRANNIGMREARGRYLCLANSDTVLQQDCMQSLVRYMEKNSDVGLVGPMVLNNDLSYQPSCRKSPSLWNYLTESLGLHVIFRRSAVFGGQSIQSQRRDTPSAVDILSGCFLLARRAAIDDIGMFDERFRIYGEDVDWSTRFHAAGWRVIYYPLARVIHHGGASSRLEPLRFYAEMTRSTLLLWRKYHGDLSCSMLILILVFHHSIRLLGGIILSPLWKSRRSLAYKTMRSGRLILWLFGEGVRILG